MKSPDIRPSVPIKETNQPTKKDTETTHVLFVEDDEDMLWLLQKVLEDYPNIELHLASNSEDARSIVEKNDVGVVFVDWSVDGPDLCKHFKTINPNIRTVAFTADQRVKEAEKSQFDEYFLKPFDLSALEETIGNNVDSWRASQKPEEKSPQAIVDFRK